MIVTVSPDVTDCQPQFETFAEVTSKEFQPGNVQDYEKNILFLRSPVFTGKVNVSDKTYADVREGDRVMMKQGTCRTKLFIIFSPTVIYQNVSPVMEEK